MLIALSAHKHTMEPLHKGHVEDFFLYKEVFFSGGQVRIERYRPLLGGLSSFRVFLLSEVSLSMMSSHQRPDVPGPGRRHAHQQEAALPRRGLLLLQQRLLPGLQADQDPAALPRQRAGGPLLDGLHAEGPPRHSGGQEEAEGGAVREVQSQEAADDGIRDIGGAPGEIGSR